MTIDCLVSVVIVCYWLSSDGCRGLTVDCLMSVVVVCYWLLVPVVERRRLSGIGGCNHVLVVGCRVLVFDRQCRLSLIFRRLNLIF